MKDTSLLALDRARSAIISRDYDEAKRICNQILRSNPEHPEALELLGSVYVKSGDDKDALAIFMKILRLVPGNFNAQDNLGSIYRRLGNYQASLDILEEALKDKAHASAIYYNMGQTYKLMGKYEEAAACFIAVTDENPNDVLAFNHLGCIYALKGDHKKALQTFNRALLIDPNHPILHFNSAQSLEKLNKPDEACASYEKALRSRPDWVEAMNAYADLLARTRQFSNAESVLKQAKQFNNKSVKTHELLARLLYAKNDLAGSEQEWRKVLEANEAELEALSTLAEIFEMQTRLPEAIDMRKKIEEYWNDIQENKLKLTKLLLRTDKAAEAEELLSRLTETDPKNPEIMSLQGQYYAMTGDAEKANEVFNELSALSPGAVDHWKELALHYISSEKLPEAEVMLRKYLAGKPKDSDAWLLLASIYEKLGKVPQAVVVYRHIFGFDPMNRGLHEQVAALSEQNAGNADLMRLLNDIITAQANNGDNIDDLGRILEAYERAAANSERLERLKNRKSATEGAPEDGEDLPGIQQDSGLPVQEKQALFELPIDAAQQEEEAPPVEEEELDFEQMQEDLDTFAEEYDSVIENPLIPSGFPVDADFLEKEETLSDEGLPSVSDPVEEEEVLDLGDSSPDNTPRDLLEEREEIEEREQTPPPPRYPEYPQYPPYEPPERPPAKKAPPLQSCEPEVEAEPEEFEPDQLPEDEIPVEAVIEENEADGEVVPIDLDDLEQELAAEEEASRISADDGQHESDEAADLPAVIEDVPLEELEKKLAEQEAETKTETAAEPDKFMRPAEEPVFVSVKPEPPKQPERAKLPEAEISKVLQDIRSRQPGVTYGSAAKMFEFVRDLCDYLPSERKSEFEVSENRLQLEYVINRLQGKPRLIEEAGAIKELEKRVGSDSVAPYAADVSVSEDKNPSENSATAEPVKKERVSMDAGSIKDIMAYLCSLSTALPNKKIAGAIDTNVKKLLSRMDPADKKEV